MISATLSIEALLEFGSVVNPTPGWRKEVSDEESEFREQERAEHYHLRSPSTSPRTLMKTKSTEPLLSRILVAA
jgi:hypothetical protein